MAFIEVPQRPSPSTRRMAFGVFAFRSRRRPRVPISAARRPSYPRGHPAESVQIGIVAGVDGLVAAVLEQPVGKRRALILRVGVALVDRRVLLGHAAEDQRVLGAVEHVVANDQVFVGAGQRFPIVGEHQRAGDLSALLPGQVARRGGVHQVIALDGDVLVQVVGIGLRLPVDQHDARRALQQVVPDRVVALDI